MATYAGRRGDQVDAAYDAAGRHYRRRWMGEVNHEFLAEESQCIERINGRYHKDLVRQGRRLEKLALVDFGPAEEGKKWTLSFARPSSDIKATRAILDKLERLRSNSADVWSPSIQKLKLRKISNTCRTQFREGMSVYLTRAGEDFPLDTAVTGYIGYVSDNKIKVVVQDFQEFMKTRDSPDSVAQEREFAMEVLDRVTCSDAAVRWCLDVGPHWSAYRKTVNGIIDVTTKSKDTPKYLQPIRSLLIQEELSCLQNFCAEVVSPPGLALDASQLRAVRVALEQNFTLIQGPPGAGKTTTICGLVYCLLREHSKHNALPRRCPVYVAADSHTAVNQVLESLEKYFPWLEILRVGGSQRLTALQVEKFGFGPKIKQHELYSELRIARQNLEKAMLTCNNAEIKNAQSIVSSLEKTIKRDILDLSDVVLSTCIAGGGMDDFPGHGNDRYYRFQNVIQDEGSQSTEPRQMIAASKAIKRLIQGGDTKQLPPVVLSKSKLLEKSMFQRFSDLASNHATWRLASNHATWRQTQCMLETQYRMHPQICQWPSSKFYDGRLTNGCGAADRQLFMHGWLLEPIRFVDTISYCKKHRDCTKYNAELCGSPEAHGSSMRNCNPRAAGSSKWNPLEVHLTTELVLEILAKCELTANRKVRPADIGVISPYWAQVNHLRRSFEEAEIPVKKCMENGVFNAKEDDGIEVDTVDGFQGREKAIIVVSLVRTAKIGFLVDARRMNVMLTRSMNGLFLVGNGRLFNKTKIWKSWMEFIWRNGFQTSNGRLY